MWPHKGVGKRHGFHRNSFMAGNKAALYRALDRYWLFEILISSMFRSSTMILCYFNTPMHVRGSEKFAERSRLFSFKRSLRMNVLGARKPASIWIFNAVYFWAWYFGAESTWIIFFLWFFYFDCLKLEAVDFVSLAGFKK